MFRNCVTVHKLSISCFAFILLDTKRIKKSKDLMFLTERDAELTEQFSVALSKTLQETDMKELSKTFQQKLEFS